MQNKLIFCLALCFCLISCINFDQIQQKKKSVKENSILLLNIKGIITSELSEELMRHVREYLNKEQIKGVLIRVNSPGGTVGASQEINSLIREVKDFYKKACFCQWRRACSQRRRIFHYICRQNFYQ